MRRAKRERMRQENYATGFQDAVKWGARDPGKCEYFGTTLLGRPLGPLNVYEQPGYTDGFNEGMRHR